MKKGLFDKISIAAAVVTLILAGFYLSGFWKERTVYDHNGKPIGAVSGPDFPGPYFAINGLQEYVFSGNWAAGTTTIFSIQNPTSPSSTLSVFPNTGATYTVAFLELNQTFAATSTFQLACGTSYSSSAPQVSAAPTNVFTSVGDTVTSTIFWTQTRNASPTPLLLGPTQFFYCVAQGKNGEDPLGNSGGYDSAFTNSATTTFGSYKLKLVR